MSETDWSLEVGPGWRNLVLKATGAIEALGGTIKQVKEKFGGLRIYADGPEIVHKISDWAEKQSKTICEECGESGRIEDMGGGWLKCVCPQHSNQEKT